MDVPESMTAARMYEIGGKQHIEQIPTPTVGASDVLVRVRSCGIVPNLGNILANWSTWFPDLPLPPLPAVFGLDPAGDVVAIGSHVMGIEIGDRVYVNPGRSCGTCRHCMSGDQQSCRYYAFNGYFGFSKHSEKLYAQYSHGGLCQFMNAPATSVVKIPNSMSFDQAARFGYIGTGYAAVKKAGAGPAATLLISGATGTLGLGAVISALALGTKKIFGTGRNRDLLNELKALAPHQIETFCIDDGSVADWVRSLTDGDGADGAVDCMGPGALHEKFLEGLYSVRRGGALVNVGAVAGHVPIDVHYMMDRNISLIGSVWFTTEEGREMAALVASNALNVSIFEHHAFPLEQVNEAISGLEVRHGGFSNYVIHP